ncbi:MULTISPECIES: energy transducer TonB [unclassified Pseudoalteromonas]|uniref:energy transducer TonB n=1 Tax=unclassified Pseudoalteromonas TaxID=194690 RepID=UPI000CF71BFB|nr:MULTISPECIES: energy transducer TonB [unclassified Pseudoalteromonas]MBS3797680.1 energy transducer TonB [Pseudoalteromonas sp. BDTF-M6]
MRLLLPSILIAVLLGGCMATQEQHLSAEPLEISSEQLHKYWRQERSEFTFSTRTFKKPPTENGYIKMRYLIDSNGEIFDVAIIESQPEGLWDTHALRSLKHLKYVPSSDNTELTPVYVTTDYHFNVN